MAVGLDLFDRCINVQIYDNNRVLLAEVRTPEYGPKPEIKVEGTILSNTYQIGGKVTITNLERSVPVENAKFLIVDLYYGGAAVSAALHKQIIYSVLFADQSKQPPNRQVCFNCIVSGTTPDIMSYRTSIGKLDANNKPMELSLATVLKDVISAYNKALLAAEPSWYDKLRLAPEPELRMTDTAKTNYNSTTIAAQWTDAAISEILDSLMEITVATEPIAKNAASHKYYLAFNYYIDNNKLVVAELPSNAFIPITGQKQLELNYVLSAYRYGPQVHVRALFDPRINQDMVISISATNLTGKKAAGNLIPLLSDAALGVVLFRPVGGIQFAFSTTSENWMQMQGVMYV